MRRLSIRIALVLSVFGGALVSPSFSHASELAVVEISNERYAIRDRCMTCHASEQEALDHAAPAADRFHSLALIEKHPVAEFGCAVCHAGDPLATEKQVAHGRERAGNRQLLTGLHVQSRCVRCHGEAQIPGTEFLQRGLALIDDRNCFACHEVPGGDPRARKAPRLEKVGEKVYPEWIVRWLMDPSAYSSSSRMPNFDLDEKQAQALASYLTSRGQQTESPATPTQKERVDRAEARRLIKGSACLDCHRLRGAGGDAPGIRAPDLSHVGDKVRPEWIVRWLVEGPEHLQPGAGMPSFRFSEEQAQLIARYLTETFRTKHPDPARPAMADFSDPEQIAEGRLLYHGLGCLNCHGQAGDPAVVKIGPDLRQIGDRDVRGVYWPGMGKDWNMRLVSYLRTKVSRPRAFSESHRMPDFGLTPEETEAIVVALLSYSGNPIPEASRLAVEEVSFERGLPSGPAAAVFQRFQCLQCHALRNAYGQLAPDLGWEGDRVYREWLVRYLKSPYAIRPAISARMPNFSLSHEEVEAVADYMEASLWDENVPPDPFEGKPPSPELVDAGEALFVDEYSCLDCHVVGDEGEEDGPELTHVGRRLQPGWLYQWVLDPQRYYASDMDSQDVTEQDALAITAYLMDLAEQAAE